MLFLVTQGLHILHVHFGLSTRCTMNGSSPNSTERKCHNSHNNKGSCCSSSTTGELCLGLDLHGWLRLLTYWAIFFLRPMGYSAIGIFTVEFREYFQDASQQQIAWIAACQMGIVALFCCEFLPSFTRSRHSVSCSWAIFNT